MKYIANLSSDIVHSDNQLDYFNSVHDFKLKNLIGTDVDNFEGKIDEINTYVYYKVSDSIFDDEDEAESYCDENDIDFDEAEIVWEIEILTTEAFTESEIKSLNIILRKRMKADNVGFISEDDVVVKDDVQKEIDKYLKFNVIKKYASKLNDTDIKNHTEDLAIFNYSCPTTAHLLAQIAFEFIDNDIIHHGVAEAYKEFVEFYVDMIDIIDENKDIFISFFNELYDIC